MLSKWHRSGMKCKSSLALGLMLPPISLQTQRALLIPHSRARPFLEGAGVDLLSAMSSALLNRAVDRGLVLRPGEQRGPGPQLALGKKPKGGRGTSAGRDRQAGGTSSFKDLDEGLFVTDSFGIPMEPMDLLLETKTTMQVCNVLQFQGLHSPLPPSNPPSPPPHTHTWSSA